MTTIARLGDRVLARFLRRADAGACVPNYLQHCGCTGPCPSREKLINCNGVCSTTQLLCVWCL